MMQRVLIEFVIDIPNAGVAGDVETRISREHRARLCDVLQSITGYPPFQAPNRPGLDVGTEPVTWDEGEREWVGPGDEDDDEGDDDK